MMRVATLLTCLLLLAPRAEAGEFIGRLVMEDLPEDGHFRTVEEFGFRDDALKEWMVPAGTVVDGAPIPSFFWSVVGDPWSGPYRRASVIHDYYSEVRSESWEAVNAVYYEAMLAGGTDSTKALLMYYAAERFGTRWEVGTKSIPVCETFNGSECVEWGLETAKDEILIIPDFDEAQARESIEKIDSGGLSLADVKKLAGEQMERWLLGE